ncbi:hypothetical protein BT93_L2476 [Corymbia citriodora subsp. variegata]|uniref:Uncharacterized protein n=1 Tax=Corymbia citriodora subsp. variegata TaxID=360336 RepID=A0A8T0CJX9_CORYI|nr:hypothetical protein BT93_L2476 [Corymbia citriodora subsp. variegata]
MAVHLPCFRAFIAPSPKRAVAQAPPVRAQSFREEEEGRSSSSNLVDANLSILRKRIDEAKTKDRLERCCRSELRWNCAMSGCYSISKRRKDAEASEFFELLVLVCRNIGLANIACAFFLCLASIFIHLSQLRDHFL